MGVGGGFLVGKAVGVWVGPGVGVKGGLVGLGDVAVGVAVG